MFSVWADFPFVKHPSHIGSTHIHAFDLNNVLVIRRESLLHLIALPQRALYVIRAICRLESCSLSCNHLSLVLGELAVLLLCLSPARVNLWLEELLSCVSCLSSVQILIMKVYDNLTTNFVWGALNWDFIGFKEVLAAPYGWIHIYRCNFLLFLAWNNEQTVLRRQIVSFNVDLDSIVIIRLLATFPMSVRWIVDSLNLDLWQTLNFQ